MYFYKFSEVYRQSVNILLLFFALFRKVFIEMNVNTSNDFNISNVYRCVNYLVVNPIKVNSFAYLFDCTTVGRASD